MIIERQKKIGKNQRATPTTHCLPPNMQPALCVWYFLLLHGSRKTSILPQRPLPVNSPLTSGKILCWFWCVGQFKDKILKFGLKKNQQLRHIPSMFKKNPLVKFLFPISVWTSFCILYFRFLYLKRSSHSSFRFISSWHSVANLTRIP